MISPTLQTTAPSSTGRTFQCADCFSDDPQWASLNRGVLICSECCYVHRNLGRHVSHVRSLHKGTWDRNQLELMYVLYANGSNSIWEHTLLDPQTSGRIRRKPHPHDPVIPVKENFIKEKYSQSAFTLRPGKDDEPISQEDLNRQLWSCVRTSHVITTLRLLALGADPNYADPEKQNASLHVAAKEGQALQVELLWLYGADAGQLNASELTPSQVAKLENNGELAARLEDLQFEVTNHLSMFLCGRKPDHQRKQYFLVPELISDGFYINEISTLRRKLAIIPSHCFERIVQDVYDEVDRRETIAAWNAVMQGVQLVHTGNEQCVAAFLPPHPEMSATRNQLRQKLAKCGVREFATLIVEILKEAKRRHFGLQSESGDHRGRRQRARTSEIPEGSVARDYDDVAESVQSTSRTSGSTRPSLSRKSDGLIETLQETVVVSIDDFLELKERVVDAEDKLVTAQKTNDQLLKMLGHLQSNFDRLTTDNVELRGDFKKLYDEYHQALSRKKSISNTALSSVLSPGAVHAMTRHESVGSQAGTQKNYMAGLKSRYESDPAVDSIGYEEKYNRLRKPDLGVESRGLNNISRKYSDTAASQTFPFQRIFDETIFPDNLIVETERLTKAIRLLLTDAQFNRLERQAPDHAHSIAVQVDRIMAAVPATKCSPDVTACLERISDATVKLSAKCNLPMVNADETCNAAYDVAKAAKNLLVAVHAR